MIFEKWIQRGYKEEYTIAPQFKGFNPFGYVVTSCLIESVAGNTTHFSHEFKKKKT